MFLWNFNCMVCALRSPIFSQGDCCDATGKIPGLAQRHHPMSNVFIISFETEVAERRVLEALLVGYMQPK